MRIDIMNKNHITLFLNTQELQARGYKHGESIRNIELINEIVDEVLWLAQSTHDFDIDAPMKTEASFIPEEGVYIKISTEMAETKREDDSNTSLSHCQYAFRDIEDLISCTSILSDDALGAGEVYYHDGAYILHLEESQFSDYQQYQKVKSIVSEYATETKRSIHVLREYGKPVFTERAFEEIRKHFS